MRRTRYFYTPFPIKLLSCLSLPLAAASAFACSLTGSGTLTNLPTDGGLVFQVNALNSAGQLTGYFYGPGGNPHAFIYGNGSLTDLGTLGGPIGEGLAINSSGVVTGDSYLSDFEFHAFISSSNGLIDLGTLGGTFSTPTALNSAGQVAGTSYTTNDLALRGFLYSGGVMSSVGSLGGDYSFAFGLNNNGAVVGESALTNGDIHAFLYSAGSIVDLGTLGSNYSSAFAVNDSGVVVGQSTNASGFNHGFVYSAGVMTDIGTLGGTYSSSFTLNSNGQVIGVANTLNDAETHAVLFSNGTLTDLGTLGGNASYPYAINSTGQVVGYSSLADGTVHAFLWSNGQMVDLNTLIPTNSGWVLNIAQFINDSGRVVGTGSLNGTNQAFILDLAPANQVPVAVAGRDQLIECPGQVTLDGSGSSDPDGDLLSFLWTWNGTVLGTNVTFATSLPLGTNVVTLQVTDPCGATAQTNVTITVVDTTPPTISCPGASTAAAGTNCLAPVPNVVSQVVATDSCSGNTLVLSQDPAPGTLVGLGPHTITVSATDPSGNAASCQSTFTVVDNAPPIIVSTPGLVSASVGNNCLAPVPNVVSGVVATDNCTPANQLVLTQSPAAGTMVGVGQYVIAVTVQDLAGNSTSAAVGLTVSDTTAPTILSAPSSLTLSADANCQATLPNLTSQVLASDNCTPANQLVLTQNPPAGTVLVHGQSSVTVTVADAGGNKALVTIPVSVVDTTAPTILNAPASLTLSADGNCQAVLPDVRGQVQASDNCTPANQLVLVQTPAPGTVLAHGQSLVTVTVSDLAGNSSLVSIPISVSDTTAPLILSAPANLMLSADANCQAVLPDVRSQVLASDNCTPANQLTLVQTPAAGTVLAHGQSTVTVSITDASGNATSVTIPVSVVDTTPPLIQTITATPNVLSPPNHQMVPVSVTVSASDNCDPAPVSQIVSVTANQTVAPGDIQITGPLTVSLAASKNASGANRVYTIVLQTTDASGNSSTGTVTVTVPSGNGGGGGRKG